MRKLILLVLIFAAGFLTCYTLLVDPEWYLFFKTGKLNTVPISKCEEIIAEINKYDWDTKVATAVMKAESKCNKNAKGDEDLAYEENGRQYGYSVGAFQVRILPGREDCDTTDLETNVRCSYDIYLAAGRKFTDWSMFLNAKYREYLED